MGARMIRIALQINAVTKTPAYKLWKPAELIEIVVRMNGVI